MVASGRNAGKVAHCRRGDVRAAHHCGIAVATGAGSLLAMVHGQIRRGGSTLLGHVTAILMLAALPAQEQWQLQVWTQAGAQPPARDHAALAWHRGSARMLLFGGQDLRQPAGQRRLGDTWAFDGQGWTQLHPAHSPPARAQHAMVTDGNGDVLLLGGNDEVGVIADAWRFDGSDWSPLPPPPMAVVGGGLATDPVRGVVVLPSATAVDEWDGVGWQRRLPTLAPGSVEANGDFDFTRGQLLFWCRSASSLLLRAWDGGQWSAPLLTVNTTYVAVACGYWDAHQQRTQVLAARPATTNWELNANSPTVPGRRLASLNGVAGTGMAAAADPARGGMLLFGGLDAAGQPLATTWQLRSPTASPWSITGFGQGCGGAAGVPELALVPGYPPLRGSASGEGIFRLQLSHQAPNPWNLAYLGFGWSRAQWLGLPLPLALGVLGAPNCTAHASAEVFVNVRNFGDPSTFTMYLPYLPPQAAGMHTYVQAVVFDVTAPNAIGLTTSAALDIMLGSR